jgi:hypothetical protein
MAQRKDSPNRPGEGGGNAKSSGKGGGRSASGGAKADSARNTTVRREKASPSGRDRGETSVADRS